MPSSESFLNSLHPEDRPRMEAWIASALAGQHPPAMDYRIVLPDGQIRYLHGHGDLRLDARNRPTFLFGTVQDITKQVQLQSQFLQAQKMESVGRLAAGIAHDFNNILTAISGYSEFLLTSLALDDPNRLDAKEIFDAGKRAAGLTRQLLAFSRQQVFQLRPLDLNAVLRGFEKMLRRIVREDVELAFGLGGGLGIVKADAGQIEQVVMNLVVNACDAMPKGGRIRIETANVELEPGYRAAHPDAAPGLHAAVTVSDTGSGIEPATISRIFEPFFTTKEVGKGTGLGLATVYGIAKQSGGGVGVDSEPGRGTTFTIFLPIVSEAAWDSPVRADRKPAGGTETVLLAEDETQVRGFVARALRALGYTVLEAKDPAEALALCAKAGSSIRLLLTDVVMPKMHGTELAERVRGLIPGVRVVFMSGYADASVIASEILAQGHTFLQKPLSIDSMSRQIREALDAPPAESRQSSI